MATNSYFTQGTAGEQGLIQDLVDEQIKIFGKDVKYIPRTLVDRDSLFNEDAMSTFDSAHEIEAYVANVDGFTGDGDLFSKFGVRISDQATFIISRRRFTQAVDDNTTLIVEGRPNEGDLIYFPLAKKIFEIKFVEHEAPFYQLNNLYVWELRCELFEYSDEDFETGDTTIDAIETRFANSIELTLQAGGSGDFSVGESVFTRLYYPTGGAAIANGQVASVTITDGGQGYSSPPTVTFSPPTSSGFTAIGPTYNIHFVLCGSSGAVTGSIGSGYTTGTYNLVGGSGFDGQLSLTSFGGSVTAFTANFNVVNPGFGYTNGDILQIDGGDGQAYIRLISLIPAATTTATGTATVSSSGIVTGVTITNPGYGYITAPTVTYSRSADEKTGEVKAWDSANRKLTIINRSGDLTGTLDGGTSNAQWSVETYSTIDNTNSNFDQNKYIETTADGFLDFTERNPFGEIGNQGSSL